MKTIGKGGKGGSTRKKQRLAPVFNINATAGNGVVKQSEQVEGARWKSDEEMQDDILKAIQVSLGGNASNPDEAIDSMDSDTEDGKEDKKPSAADQPTTTTVLEVDSDSEEEEDRVDQLPPPAAPSADLDLDTLVNNLINFLESGSPITNECSDIFKAIRSLVPSMTNTQFQRIKDAFQKRLLGDYERGMFKDEHDSATLGLVVTLLQLLCPVNRRGMFISYAAGDTRPAGFDPDTCATTRSLEKLLNRLRAKANHKTMTGEVRWECELDCSCGRGGRKHCKKCTVEEGGALSKVYNLLALFYYVTGGEMNFFNVGGVSTKIKENLAAHLIPEYFGKIEARGYHLSILAYFLPCFKSYDNAVTILTTWVTDLCDEMGIREAVDDMIKDKRLPMVVDLDDIDEAEREWSSGRKQAEKEDDFGRLMSSWDAFVKSMGSYDDACKEMARRSAMGGAVTKNAHATAPNARNDKQKSMVKAQLEGGEKGGATNKAAWDTAADARDDKQNEIVAARYTAAETQRMSTQVDKLKKIVDADKRADKVVCNRTNLDHKEAIRNSQTLNLLLAGGEGTKTVFQTTCDRCTTTKYVESLPKMSRCPKEGCGPTSGHRDWTNGDQLSPEQCMAKHREIQQSTTASCGTHWFVEENSSSTPVKGSTYKIQLTCDCDCDKHNAYRFEERLSKEETIEVYNELNEQLEKRKAAQTKRTNELKQDNKKKNKKQRKI